MRLSNEDSTLSTLSFYNQFFNWKIGFMYCIVYFVPAKSVDYNPRYVTKRLLFCIELINHDFLKNKMKTFDGTNFFSKKFFGRAVETETTRIWNMPRAVIDSRIISMIYVRNFTGMFYVIKKKTLYSLSFLYYRL